MCDLYLSTHRGLNGLGLCDGLRCVVLGSLCSLSQLLVQLERVKEQRSHTILFVDMAHERSRHWIRQ